MKVPKSRAGLKTSSSDERPGSRIEPLAIDGKPRKGKGRYEVLILFENNGDTALSDLYINDVLPPQFEIKDWEMKLTAWMNDPQCEKPGPHPDPEHSWNTMPELYA